MMRSKKSSWKRLKTGGGGGGGEVVQRLSSDASRLMIEIDRDLLLETRTGYTCERVDARIVYRNKSYPGRVLVVRQICVQLQVRRPVRQIRRIGVRFDFESLSGRKKQKQNVSAREIKFCFGRFANMADCVNRPTKSRSTKIEAGKKKKINRFECLLA